MTTQSLLEELRDILRIVESNMITRFDEVQQSLVNVESKVAELEQSLQTLCNQLTVVGGQVQQLLDAEELRLSS